MTGREKHLPPPPIDMAQIQHLHNDHVMEVHFLSVTVNETSTNVCFYVDCPGCGTREYLSVSATTTEPGNSRHYGPDWTGT